MSLAHMVMLREFQTETESIGLELHNTQLLGDQGVGGGGEGLSIRAIQSLYLVFADGEVRLNLRMD